MNIIKNIIQLSLVFVSITSCSMGDDNGVTETDEIVRVGDRLPVFSVTMNDGRTVTTSDLMGKPSVVVFFSTTCPDCQHELPLLNQRYLMHGTDTTFVAISREEPAPSVATYWQANALAIPYSAQTDRTVYSLFARRGIPREYVSNASGTVVKVVHP